ncbi:hypothetical protein D3C73_1499840 [compost metagenome]
MLLDQVAGDEGAGRHAHQLQFGVGADDLAEQAADQRGIVHHKHLDRHALTP